MGPHTGHHVSRFIVQRNAGLHYVRPLAAVTFIGLAVVAFLLAFSSPASAITVNGNTYNVWVIDAPGAFFTDVFHFNADGTFDQEGVVGPGGWIEQGTRSVWISHFVGKLRGGHQWFLGCQLWTRVR